MDQSLPTRTPLRSSALAYNGRVGELYAIFLLNLLLTILTVGIFRFWAITRLRRYIWSRMRFQGDRFEYIGTGGELFVGFLIAIGTIAGLGVVAALLAHVLGQIKPWLGALPIIAFYLALSVLAGAGFYSAQRYRLTRTLWRGIRGGMTGSALSYGAAWLAYGVMLPFTLFQMLPWVQIRLAERRINASFLGNAPFAFEGRARSVYGRYLLAWLGSAALLAILAGAVFATAGTQVEAILEATRSRSAAELNDPHINVLIAQIAPLVIAAVVAWSVGSALLRCWYVAGMFRHVCANTTLAGARFASTATGPGLLWLLAGNLLIMLPTLGLGLPFVIQRDLRYLARNLHIEGAIEGELLEQGTLKAPRFGEGMFQALDAGGVGL